MGDFDKARALGWERNLAGKWSKLLGSKYMEINSRGGGKYSASINGVRIKNRIGFDEAVQICEQAPQPPWTVSQKPPFDTEGEVANAIKKVLSERYASGEEIRSVLSSGTLEEVLVSFYYFAREE